MHRISTENLRLWSVSGELKGSICIASVGINSVCSAKGLVAAITRSSRVYVVDLETQDCLDLLNIQSPGPQTVAFDAKRKSIFVADASTIIKEFPAPAPIN